MQALLRGVARVTPLRQRFAHTFRSLQQRNYRLFFAGHAVSVSGTWMQRVAQDWLVLQLSGSAVALGISTALQFLPTLLLGMYGGLLVDRFDKRRLIIVTQISQAILALVLALLTLTGVVELWMVYVLALLLGTVTVVDTPARAAFVPELVEADDYVNAQGLNSTVHNAGRLVGPAIAGVLIGTAGVATAFLINAASFAAVLYGLCRMDAGALHRVAAHPRARGQVREGLRYVWERPTLRSTIVIVAVVGLFGQNFRVVLPLLAQETFGRGAAVYGMLMAMLGLGAVIGALTTASRPSPGFPALVSASLSFAVVTLLASASRPLAVAYAAMVVLGFANITLNTVGRVLLQLHSEQPMHGRVMALHAWVFLGTTPLGSYLSGWVSESYGARAGMAMGGVTTLLVGLIYARGAGRPDGAVGTQYDAGHMTTTANP